MEKRLGSERGDRGKSWRKIKAIAGISSHIKPVCGKAIPGDPGNELKYQLPPRLQLSYVLKGPLDAQPR